MHDMIYGPARLATLAIVALAALASIRCTEPPPVPPAPPDAARTGAAQVGASQAGTAATAAAAPTASGFPRTIRDAQGESLTLPTKPLRIASQLLGTDEILFAICPRERIVGVSTMARDGAYSHVVDAATALGAPPLTTVEIAVSTKPDLVFVASYSQAELVDLLRAAGIRVFRFSSFDRIDDVIGNIRIVGQAIGEEAAAERLIEDMQRRLARVRARGAASGRRPRIMSYDSAGYTAAANTLFDDVIRQAGGVNVSAEQGLKGFPRINAEQVLVWNPEYLVAGAKPGEVEDARRRLMANQAIAASSAVKAGRLILMDTRDLLTTSHHITSAAEALADALYGPEPQR